MRSSVEVPPVSVIHRNSKHPAFNAGFLGENCVHPFFNGIGFIAAISYSCSTLT